MNISRPFILRPVATSLMMVALLLAGLNGVGEGLRTALEPRDDRRSDSE